MSHGPPFSSRLIAKLKAFCSSTIERNPKRFLCYYSLTGAANIRKDGPIIIITTTGAAAFNAPLRLPRARLPLIIDAE